MHKVKASTSGEMFVKNMLILQHHFAFIAMLDLDIFVIIKTCKVKKNNKKFLETLD